MPLHSTQEIQQAIFQAAAEERAKQVAARPASQDVSQKGAVSKEAAPFVY